MSISNKAVWIMESRLDQSLTLGSLSELCAVIPYHLLRTFRLSTGLSPMAYLRARRLSVAAETIASGNIDILSVALEAQYSSHEAFTRAFFACFGVLPSTVRMAQTVENLKLLEPAKMNKSKLVNVATPEMIELSGLDVIGLNVRCSLGNTTEIPALWNSFNSRQSELNSISGAAAYGVCTNSDAEGNFEYLAGLEVEKGAHIPQGMERLSIPGGKYAVFVHQGHISEIGNTVYTIWNKSLPDLELNARQAPDFEKYDKRFDPSTGRGIVEIWIPVSD